MMRSMKITAALLALVGVCLLAGGLVFGFGGISRGGSDCGSVFTANTNPDTSPTTRDLLATETGGGPTDTQALCDAARSDRSPIVYALLAAGGVFLVTSAGLATVASARATEYAPIP